MGTRIEQKIIYQIKYKYTKIVSYKQPLDSYYENTRIVSRNIFSMQNYYIFVYKDFSVQEYLSKTDKVVIEFNNVQLLSDAYNHMFYKHINLICTLKDLELDNHLNFKLDSDKEIIPVDIKNCSNDYLHYGIDIWCMRNPYIAGTTAYYVRDTHSNKIGMMSSEYKLVIPPIYDEHLNDTDEHYCFYKLDTNQMISLYHLYNIFTFKRVLETTGSFQFLKKLQCFLITKDNLYGIVKDNKELIPCIYDEILYDEQLCEVLICKKKDCLPKGFSVSDKCYLDLSKVEDNVFKFTHKDLSLVVNIERNSFCTYSEYERFKEYLERIRKPKTEDTKTCNFECEKHSSRKEYDDYVPYGHREHTDPSDPRSYPSYQEYSDAYWNLW